MSDIPRNLSIPYSHTQDGDPSHQWPKAFAKNSTEAREFFLALLALVGLALVMVYARSWLGIAASLVSLILGVRNPYLFSLLVLPGLVIYTEEPAFPGSSWSLLRVVLFIIVVGFVVNPRPLRSALKAIPAYIIWSLGLILVAYILSAIANSWPSESTTRIISHILRSGLVAIMFISVITLRDARFLFYGLILQGITMVLGGIYLWSEYGSYMVIREFDLYEQYYLEGIVVFSTIAASYAVLAVGSGFASLGLGVMTTSKVRKAFFSLLGVALILGSLVSGRRQAVVAIIVSLFMIVAVERSRRSILLLVGIIAAAAALSTTGYFDQFFSVRESLLDEFTGHGTGRMELITYGLELWRESPLWGIGPGTQPLYYDELNRFSHHTVVSALLEGGLLAAFGLLLLMGGLFLQLVKVVKKSTSVRDKLWPIIYLCSFSNLFVYTFVTSDLLVSPAFLMLFGVISAYCVKSLEATNAEELNYGNFGQGRYER